jgi:hypothetical protein
LENPKEHQRLLDLPVEHNLLYPVAFAPARNRPASSATVGVEKKKVVVALASWKKWSWICAVLIHSMSPTRA